VRYHRLLQIGSALLLVVGLVFARGTVAGADTTVFSTDFESGIPPEFSAPGAFLDGVQGYAGLGPPGRQFGGQFLHYVALDIEPTTLKLRGLPPHDHLSVQFLMGIIDSWDGTELMQISVDNQLLFNHWFQLATGDSSDYYPPPPGALLSKSTDLGWSGCCYYNRDRAYDLGVEPAFQNIPHTADSVTVTWTIGALAGPAADQWQGGLDESWAIDDVSVEVSSLTAGVGGPTAPDDRLFFASPNPSRGGLATVIFTLGSAQPATLELFDLGGRRIEARQVGALGAGVHRATFGAGRQLAAGVYYAKLSAGSDVRTTRLAILR